MVLLSSTVQIWRNTCCGFKGQALHFVSFRYIVSRTFAAF